MGVAPTSGSTLILIVTSTTIKSLAFDFSHGRYLGNEVPLPAAPLEHTPPLPQQLLPRFPSKPGLPPLVAYSGLAPAAIPPPPVPRTV